VLTHLREVVGHNRGAFIKLCHSGVYRIYSPAAHDRLQATAHKHKPWAIRSRAIRAAQLAAR